MSTKTCVTGNNFILHKALDGSLHKARLICVHCTVMSTCKAMLYDADVAALAKIFGDMLFFNATDLASSECHSWKIKESMLSGMYT